VAGLGPAVDLSLSFFGLDVFVVAVTLGCSGASVTRLDSIRIRPFTAPANGN
jgi:hypothetical protein